MESPKPARGAGGGWIHPLAGRPAVRVESAPRYYAAVGEQIASLERRDRVYGWLLFHGSLHAQHKEKLLARGFTSKQIEERHYISLAEGRARLCREVAEAGDELEGVPGFYQKQGADGRPYWSIAGASGLLIPCLDPQGRIRGLRIRPDEASGGGKYRWLSSVDRPGGASSGVHCHVAQPSGGIRFERAVWVTEGELKADFAADRLGAAVVSVPGVSSWALALNDVKELLPNGGRVVVAFDSDWRINPPVHQAMWGIAQAATALGYTVEVATWDSTFKGIDDLLATGRQPTRTSLAALPEPAWTLKLSSRITAEWPTQRKASISLTEMREKLRRQQRAPLRRCA